MGWGGGKEREGGVTTRNSVLIKALLLVYVACLFFKCLCVGVCMCLQIACMHAVFKSV